MQVAAAGRNGGVFDRIGQVRMIRSCSVNELLARVAGGHRRRGRGCGAGRWRRNLRLRRTRSAVLGRIDFEGRRTRARGAARGRGGETAAAMDRDGGADDFPARTQADRASASSMGSNRPACTSRSSPISRWKRGCSDNCRSLNRSSESCR